MRSGCLCFGLALSISPLSHNKLKTNSLKNSVFSILHAHCDNISLYPYLFAEKLLSHDSHSVAYTCESVTAYWTSLLNTRYLYINVYCGLVVSPSSWWWMFEQQQVSVFAFWWFVQQALKYLWEAKLPTLFGYIMTTSICHCKSGILFVIEILFVTPYLWNVLTKHILKWWNILSGHTMPYGQDFLEFYNLVVLGTLFWMK